LKIPVIDIFAGPGGLGEGFSSVPSRNKRAFEIKLSIEMDSNAHETLQLRSFVRQFFAKKIPQEYYEVMVEKDPETRLKRKSELLKNIQDKQKKQNKKHGEQPLVKYLRRR
jgi:DNA (cytosine-5)-methyltransferase 1